MEAIYRFDGHELDLQLFELRAGGEPCHLEPQVFEVLAYLVRNHDRLVTKQELMDHVWPDSYVSEAALNTRIMAARKAIGDNGRDQRLIRTVHGRGFRFVAEVTGHGSRLRDAGTDTPNEREAPALPPPDTIEPPVSSLVGRAAELSLAEELLGRPGCRLVTILGPGGVGKTRFAFELGCRRDSAGEPFAWIPLEPIHQASELPAAIAAAIGLPAGTADATEDVVRRLAGRRLLLILDNAEQVASGVAEILGAILAGAPGVRAVVTSRVVLGLRDEWVFTLNGLSLEEDAPGRSEAARLLISRATQADAASPGFEAEDLQAVSEICRLVDGMPLAIELAASLCRFLRPALLASLIRTNLDTLEADLAYVPQRHRSIPSLLAESCSRLDERQRRALFALAVFEAPFTVDAAGAVAGANLPVLRALVDRSLLHVDSGRFSLHPLMRQYAQEQLGAELEQLRPAHAAYFMGMLAQVADSLDGGEQVAATQQLDAEFVNISVAWRWACAHGRIDLLESAALPLGLFIQFRARFLEGDGLMADGVKAVQGGGDAASRLLALLLVNHAWILFRLGRGYEAAECVERAATTLARSGEDPLPGMGTDPMAARAALAHAAARYDDVQALALESASRAGKREDLAARAFGLWLGGSAMMRKVSLTFGPGAGHEQGTYAPDGEAGARVVAEASQLQDEASTILAAIGDKWLLAFVEMERAVLSSARGDFRGACRALENAYQLRREFNDPLGMASALISYADALVDLRELDDAEPRLRLSYQLIRDLGEASMMSEVMRSFATAALVRRDVALALDRAAESMRLARSVGFKANVASGLRLTGEALHVQGDFESALNLFAFVVLHPGGSAFSTAKAKASIRCLAPLVEPEAVARAWARAAKWDIDELALSVARHAGKSTPLLGYLPG